MTTSPASEHGFKTVTGVPKELALTKAEHDAIVARRQRNLTDDSIGTFTTTRAKPATPHVEALAMFGVHITKGEAA